MTRKNELICSSVGLTCKLGLFPISYPTILYLKITTRCMLNCKFCSQNNEKSEDMDVGFIKQQLQHLRKLGVQFLYITGGEPLLHPHICEISKYAHELGYTLALVTNGVLLDEYKRKSLLKYFTSIGISLHGMAHTHDMLTGELGCFDKVLSNIKQISRQYPNVHININYTATEDNLNSNEMLSVANLCKEYELSMSVARLNYIGKGTNYDLIDINRVAQSVDDLIRSGYNIRFSNCVASCLLKNEYKYLSSGCSAGHTIAAIEANGDVKICASSNQILGNLYRNSFKDIWNDKRIRKYQSFSWIPHTCKICPDLIKCKAGCKSELGGKFWQEISDYSLNCKFEKVWEELLVKKIDLNFTCLRKEKRGYVSNSIPVRFFNNNAKEVILSINGTSTSKEIIEKFATRFGEKNVMDFLICLKINNLIRIED